MNEEFIGLHISISYTHKLIRNLGYTRRLARHKSEGKNSEINIFKRQKFSMIMLMHIDNGYDIILIDSSYFTRKYMSKFI